MADSIPNVACTRAMASASEASHTLLGERDNVIVSRGAYSISQTISDKHKRTTLEALDDFARSEDQRDTILYLAYGSNLSVEKFKKDRGIKPLSQVNVQVPSLRLTFDLPGIPYSEPCFANSARRDPDHASPEKDAADNGRGETVSVDVSYKREEYRKDRWHKGLVGVVYEVTPKDYAHIIATEGGGSGYQDILVDCHPFASSDPALPVPSTPTLPAFKAHTLFASAEPPKDDDLEDRGALRRPDPSYAQPSARYLKLITDGAAELCLPDEYQHYLQCIRPYTITTVRQRVGQFVFLSLWGPVLLFVFSLGKIFADKNGLVPKWLGALVAGFFRAVWASYDAYFKPTFGEGERSLPDIKRGTRSTPAAQQHSLLGVRGHRGEIDVEKLPLLAEA